MRPGSAVRAHPPVTGVPWLIAAVSALALLLPGGARAQDPSDAPGLELTSPVRLQLRLLNEHWRTWTRAFYQVEEETAASALEQLLATADRLGMPRLPDLASAASAFAVSAAASGDFDRSGWALDAARQLDPGRPETHFAAAAVKVESETPTSRIRRGRGAAYSF